MATVTWYTLEYHAPGKRGLPIAVLVYAPSDDTLHLLFRKDFRDVAPEEADYLELLASDLARTAVEIGPSVLIAHLYDTLSNILQISEPHVETTDAALQDFTRSLFRTHVQSDARTDCGK
jgi:hypothetical protein